MRTRPDVEAGLLRDAVRQVVEAPRFDDWLLELPDPVLESMAAPLEILSFHYYLDPPKDRPLQRAARVACESVRGRLEDCPQDMAAVFRGLSDAVGSPVE